VNIAAAYEQAVATVIREFYAPGDGVVIRCWQNLRRDALWSDAGGVDKAAQSIDIRAAPPVSDEDQVNMTTALSVECFCKAADDRDHAIIAAMYDAAQSAMDALHYQFVIGPTGDELTRFLAVMADEIGGTFGFGGFTYGDSTAPYNDAGYNAIGMSLILHYSRQATA